MYATVLGRPYDPKAKLPPLYFVGPALCMLVTACTSAYLMHAASISSLAGALQYGALVGAGYLGVTAINMGINPNVPKPLPYGLLSGAFFFVSSLLISVTLYLLR